MKLLIDITHELANVCGGTGPYKSLVFHVGGNIGGDKLADGVYGRHATAADRKRARSAMKKYLAAGGKLPNGVPRLFE
jgi:hypothetical protein